MPCFESDWGMRETGAPWPPRHLLRDVKRHVFYTANGGWTEDPDSARDFQDIKEMLEICDKQQLRDVEVVEYFGRELKGEGIVQDPPAN